MEGPTPPSPSPRGCLPLSPSPRGCSKEGRSDPAIAIPARPVERHQPHKSGLAPPATIGSVEHLMPTTVSRRLHGSESSVPAHQGHHGLDDDGNKVKVVITTQGSSSSVPPPFPTTPPPSPPHTACPTLFSSPKSPWRADLAPAPRRHKPRARPRPMASPNPAPGSSPFPFADGASARRRSCPQFLPRFGASPHRGTTPSPWGIDNVDSVWPHRSQTNPATVALLLTDKDLESEESMYERWSSVHTVSRDLTEKQSRFEAFKANSRHIGEFNKMKDVPYKLGLNKGLAIDNLDYIFTVGAPSIINHSCVPNAVLIFDGRTAYVRALQPINKDEEVSISYIETAAVTKKRNNDLKQYFFTCTCPRCVKGFDEDALLEGFRCKSQACDGFLLPNSGKKAYTCQKCGASRDVEEIKNMRSKILQLSDKASSFLSSGNKAEAGSIYKIIKQLERNLYHAFSTTLLHTCETLLKIYLELQDWWTALTYCRLTIPVYERVYPPFHPMIGLQFYTCGKLECLGP
uniref:SET domain-containing protein n=2 Tax=Zea mays TaxID=4577 RepID=A0A804RAC8_MAIZE